MYLYKCDNHVDCVFFHLFTISLLRHLNVFSMKENTNACEGKGDVAGINSSRFLIYLFVSRTSSAHSVVSQFSLTNRTAPGVEETDPAQAAFKAVSDSGANGRSQENKMDKMGQAVKKKSKARAHQV